MFLEKMDVVKEENRKLVSDIIQKTFDLLNILVK